MRNIWTVFKKEIYRVLSDVRLILTVFILPGLSIFIIYSIMGSVITTQMSEVEEHVSKLYVENLPGEIETLMDVTMNYEIVDTETLERETLDANILDGTFDLAIIFPEDFMTSIENFETMTPPSLDVLYNQGRQHSQAAFSRFNRVLGMFHENTVISRLDDPSDYQVYLLSSENIVDERTLAGQGFAMLMPMLVIIFLFAGAMSIGPDAIAGEKERGTIATLLVTPIRRSQLAMGKVASLSLLSLVSALSSFLGIILSLPRLMAMDERLPDMGVYTASDYFVILILLMSTVIFIVALIAILSTYAKTIKEASMLIMPFYFIAIIIGVMNSFGADASDSLVVHLVPIYSTVNMLTAIMTFEYTMLNLLATVISSVAYTILFIFILNKMFNSEKVMFQK